MNYFATQEEGFVGTDLWTDLEQAPWYYYFDSYAYYGVYEEILKDSPRLSTYRNAILRNRYLFKDKVVLDLDCGTGILSFFAVQAGARKVYAVDDSAMVNLAATFARKNGLDSQIEFIQSKVSDLQLPEQVDILLSDWMGVFLLLDSAVDKLLLARDKWLKPDGLET